MRGTNSQGIILKTKILQFLKKRKLTEIFLQVIQSQASYKFGILCHKLLRPPAEPSSTLKIIAKSYQKEEFQILKEYMK